MEAPPAFRSLANPSRIRAGTRSPRVTHPSALPVSEEESVVSKELEAIQNDKRELDMTPMIDVTFLLLVFFMCTLQFKTLEGKLAAYLPKDVGIAPPDPPPLEAIAIQLDVVAPGTKLIPATNRPHTGTGRYVFDDSRVVRYRVGPLTTTDLAVVEQRLHELHRRDPERPVTIDARPGIVYGDVVPTLDAVMGARFKDITFVGSWER